MENLENSENLTNSEQVMVIGGGGAGTAAAVAHLLYDANAVQRIPVWLNEEDETEPIILIVKPLSDERYIVFAENSALKIVDDGNSISRTNSQALGKLWDNLVSDVENVEFEGGVKPENWKECFDLLQFKIPTMNKFLVVSVYEVSKTSNGKVVIGISNERTIFADLYFNGEVVTTKHFLKRSNFEIAKALELTQKMPFGNKSKGLQETNDIVLPNSVKGKAALFETMKVRESEGFKDNIIPIRVKSEIVDFIARSQTKEKK